MSLTRRTNFVVPVNQAIGAGQAAFNLGKKLKQTVIKDYFKKSSTSNIKKTVRSMAEVRHKYLNTGGTINDTTLYSMNITGNIPQGDDAESREGDSVFLEALKVRAHFNSVRTDDTFVRMWILKLDTDAHASSDAFNTGTIVASDFVNTTNQNIITAMNIPRNASILYDKTYKVPVCQIVGQDRTLNIRFTKKLKKKFVYKRDSNYGKFNNIYIVIAAYSNSATPGSTADGSIEFNGDLIFKNTH